MCDILASAAIGGNRHGGPGRNRRRRASGCLWPFGKSGRESFVDIKSRVLVDSGEAALRLAIAGCGITRLADLIASEAIREGQLKSVLAETHVAGPAVPSGEGEQGCVSLVPGRPVPAGRLLVAG